MSQTSGDDSILVEIVRRHLEPTLEMLRRTIQKCPDEVWDAENDCAAFWQHGNHTLLGLDFWLSDPGQQFKVPSFHTDDAAKLVKAASPALTREQIESYLEKVHAKRAAFFDGLTLDALGQESEMFGKAWAVGDKLLMQLRHVQHHVGYMNCILRANGCDATRWIGYNE